MSWIRRVLSAPASRHPLTQLIRYGIVVGSGYLLVVAFYSGELAIGIPAYAGFGVAFVVNGLYNFVFLRLWAFPPSGRGFRGDLLRFCLVAVSAFVVNYSSFAVLYSVIGLTASTAQRLAIVIGAPITFLANRLWSFRARRSGAVCHSESLPVVSARNE